MATRTQFKMTTAERRHCHFSDSFKIQKVRKFETGKAKVSELCKQYEVADVSVYRWLNKFGTMKDKMIESAEDTYGVDIKKGFHPTIEYFWYHREQYQYNRNKIYKSLEISKQSFHQQMDRMYRLQSEKKQLLLFIYQIREDHPTMDVKDMYFKLQPRSWGKMRLSVFAERKV